MKIKILREEGIREIICQEKESILDACIREKEVVSNFCGGNGICGKCKIRLLEGKSAVTCEDTKFFSEEELNAGYRLACCAFPSADCMVEFIQQSEMYHIVSSYDKKKIETSFSDREDSSFYIVVDIGTTTVVMQLLQAETRKLQDTYVFMNPQRLYGADVMARIQASIEGRRAELRILIQEKLREGILYFAGRNGENEFWHRLHKIAIAGNTTMIHLFMGYSCEGLSRYPFTPVTTQRIKMLLTEFFPELDSECEIVILPAVSAFIGGDIVAGIFYCGLNEREEVNLFVDLGTNGEMAIGNRREILVASTAAGPAFEGGNISCGMGSVPGAVCGARIHENGKMVLETIGGKTAKGICGTGLVEVIYEFLQNHWIDETGRMEGDVNQFVLSEEGLALTQKDIREFQLAKAAVRAGIETLLKEYDIDYAKINHLYIAGGFGCQINMSKAAGVGLIPLPLMHKAVSVGNSSLGGSEAFIFMGNAEEKVEQLLNKTKEISLAGNKFFQEYFVEAMYFGEEELFTI